MQRLQPDIPESDEGVSVLLRGGMFEDAFELLLSWAPFLLGQMEITDEGPSVRIILIDLKRLFEPIGSFVYLTPIAGHAAQAEIAVDVVAMLA